MDPLLRLTIRLAQWLRHPPSRQQVILMAVVVALCLLIAGAERLFSAS